MRIVLFAIVAVMSFHPLFAQQQRDVSFTIVEKPPIYPNCKGANVELLKECFTNNIQQVIREYMNFEQFEKHLPKGLHRVFVTFTIDEAGLVTKIKVRSPFTIVQKKTKEALQHIPVMEPAIHKERPSATAFATAFSIQVKKGKPQENNPYNQSRRQRNVDSKTSG